MASDGSEDHLPINDQRLSHGIAMRDNPGKRKSGTKGGGRSSHSDNEEDSVQYVVIVKFDDSYLRTCPGIVRFLQLVSSADVRMRRILKLVIHNPLTLALACSVSIKFLHIGCDLPIL